jgi:homoserine O-succinyltransferase/O-acetyltransferase
MPVMVEKCPLADRVVTAHRPARVQTPPIAIRSYSGLTVGLVNNMPDSALESTEQQFLTLMDEAARDFAVEVKLLSIDSIPRGERGRRHLRAYYSDIRELWGGRLDGLIVTGTEPRAPDLVDEPYWTSLIGLFDWAQQNTTTTIFSCLAAHAAVLHLDGIRRVSLPEKRFGVFQHEKRSNHFLLKGAPAQMATPHSRWNELPGEALASSGYNILTASPEAGVEMFTQHKKSLFVFFQGHPEYEAETLWREYRRDVGRYLRGEQSRYPCLPTGYFSCATVQLLQDFRLRAEARRREELLSEFPAAQVPPGIAATWRGQAIRSYRNWFTYMAQHRKRMQSGHFSALRPASVAP